MNSEVLQSLISAGIPPANATRVANAIAKAYGKPSTQSALAPAAPAVQRAVSQRAVSQSAVTQAAAPDTENIAAGRVSVARTLTVGDGAASFGAGVAKISSQAILEGGLISSAGAQFAGDNVFLGPVTLSGQVDWDGPRSPATVEVLSFAEAAGNSVRLKRSQLAVLNDYGDAAPGSLQFALNGASGSVVTSVSTASKNVVTKVTWDAANCTITTTSEQVWVVTGVGSQSQFLPSSSDIKVTAS